MVRDKYVPILRESMVISGQAWQGDKTSEHEGK